MTDHSDEMVVRTDRGERYHRPWAISVTRPACDPSLGAALVSRESVEDDREPCQRRACWGEDDD